MNTKHIFYILALLAIAVTSTSNAAPLVNCGDYITTNVTLDSDLHCTSGYTALEVGANNITIDLNGHVLSGTSDLMGVLIHARNNVTIKNGWIRGFWGGINTARSDKLRIDNVSFYGMNQGLIMAGTDDGSVTNSDFINLNGTGVRIYTHSAFASADRNTIQNNEFYQVRVGVGICGTSAENNVIADNLMWKTVDNAIALNHANRNKISGNRILDQGDGAAIRINSSFYNDVFNNTLQTGQHSALSILANAASPCLEPAEQRSGKNRFYNNRVDGFDTAINLGLGTDSGRYIEGNGILSNQIHNSNIGIMFRSDAYSNYARDNNFTGTTTPIYDLGINNNY
ncbi:hypothetical protein GCM10008090_24960 [Arenicella chitinivorans]|uniref:Right handed beta helix domain-containing protein n=1 Tax=Arenicella chitinivorans TaxID=1329800 RepID=A0A918RX10_9GAMM|nr:right-handed parallel beta-helix repeat-containing protein [Arenicella chitinivorans]GHA14187.1 hypothetical protein GCM10008090_24960 [Arenicella chitinivorans]